MVELKKRNNGKIKKNVANVAGNFRSVSSGKMLQPKMDCRHIVKSAVMFMPKTVRKLRGGNLKKIYSNPELARFSPRELIAELKARGYTGELKYTQTISL